MLAVKFQIMKVDFADEVEDSITPVQVAEQTKVINLFEQQVQEVVKSTEAKKAESTVTGVMPLPEQGGVSVGLCVLPLRWRGYGRR